MKKLAISLAIASALGLAACGDSLDDIKEDVAQEGTVVPSSRVVFDPGAGDVSVPNDLLFLGTTDGTLTLDADSQDYTNPQTALGALDGWSTQNPFSIELRFAPGVSLDAQSASAPGAVRLFEVVMGGPTSSAEECQALPQGVACQLVGELAFGQDFFTAASGNNVAVIPFRPLKGNTTYIVALTETLRDSEGRSIAPSTTYELLQQDLTTAPLGSAQQRQLQGVINSYESVVSSGGLDKSSVIYTAAITTQSTADVLATTKQLLAAGIQQGAQPVVQVQNTGMTVADLSPQFPVEQGFGLVRYYAGSVTLPYYSGVPTEENPQGPLNTSWTARCDTGAIIASLSDEQITGLESELEGEQMMNDAFCNAASGGSLRDFGLDERRHLTKFNTIPLPRVQASLDVQMTVPDENAFTMPDAGWPVVMLQHGITSCKENMLAVTSALTQAGFATVAIDHPLHGSRGFGPINASGASCGLQGNATVYMNLGNLLVTRDNLRQSIHDMLGLRLALNFTQGVELDTTNVHVLGHSLGAIAGSSMVALANTSTGNLMLDALYEVQSVNLAMPGGAVANFLLDSPQFGGLIKASVILGADDDNSAALVGFAVANGCPAPGTASEAQFTGCVAQYVDDFLADLTMSGETAALAQIQGNLTRFAFAAQTITDSGDPNNYLQQLIATDTPVHMLMVAGDGDMNLPDQVIPNGYFNPAAALAAGSMPLAGTEPMARLLGAATIPAVAGPVPVEGAAISRFIAGDHGSILSPASSAAVTGEMQMQMASFFATGGAAVNVTNPMVLQSNE
ncbi:lipase [Alkalimonas collagenimarina]|uniref:Lipase n=1 Tax=Alkalimonas collagenimarina TaxID=400390 RepID=A0ABT9H325_9GAMM|nr:VolA/Pla-1 family phospholipase [Alkalimonas collagenimarina]MDP4537721.1 lipase [Alkalimonas collagenimarina]